MKRKLIMLFALLSVILGASAQKIDLEQAKQQAKAENKLILLKFSGSDWCIPCIQLQKDVIDNEAFVNFAKEKVIVLLADFPRRKKNLLPKDEQAVNEQLAERYNPKGEFPLMVLLDADGKELFHWEGFNKNHGVQGYIADISHFTK